MPFSSKLTPSGGSGTYTFAIGAGSLPAGVALAPDGTVSGTPRAAGIFRATLRLSDSEGRTLDYAANFGVAARLKVGTLALRPGKVGRLYRSKVTATGGIAPRKWKIAVGPLPKGIRFDRTTGILSGTPTKAGRYRMTFQVTDGLKVVATKTASHRRPPVAPGRARVSPRPGRESHNPCCSAEAGTSNDGGRGLGRGSARRRDLGPRDRHAQLTGESYRQLA